MSKKVNSIILIFYILSDNRVEEIEYYQALKLQAAIKGYNYFLTDPLNCDLKPGAPTYRRLEKVPGILKEQGYSKDQIKSVRKQFEVCYYLQLWKSNMPHSLELIKSVDWFRYY